MTRADKTDLTQVCDLKIVTGCRSFIEVFMLLTSILSVRLSDIYSVVTQGTYAIDVKTCHV